MENEKEMLEEKADLYISPDAGRQVDQALSRHMVDAVFPMLQGTRIMEMGFGDNYWTDGIIRKFGHAHIVDASQKLLTEAKRLYGDKVSTYQSFFEEFEPDNAFDTVLATFILDHVSDPVTVLRQARTWLADDGQIIIMVPHANSLHRRLAVCMGMQNTTTDLGSTDITLNHRRVYTIERLSSDIADAGLRIIELGGLLTKALPQAMLGDLPDEVLRGMVRLGAELPVEYSAVLVCRCRAG